MKWTPTLARNAVEGLGPPEGGSYTRAEILSAWQFLIDNGQVEVLGGWFARAAEGLIKAE